jgi:DNA polymerase-3 subunit gamma/tau
VAARSKSKQRSSSPGTATGPPGGEAGKAAPPYTVVARRYRPQRFEDVVGQDHVVRALRNTIKLNRIAQAYLFCGTRGVGKTSIARIFAKCLNCVKGPTDQPCQVCDICESVALGQDVDVIEIDGASNNGVEQVRELRQSAALRPSRGRYKVYYIDEVHMLTTGAFNALLKTLEEPPPHVKFLFSTTEPNKIPITVLSRCQRYDFAGITPDAIAASLREICTAEQVEAEPEALEVVARRAGGSLRDGQSLLDRLMASGRPRLTVEVVHELLGTASDDRLLAMMEALADHDSRTALRLVEQSANEGVQPGELVSGLIEFVRDAMVLSVGAESMLLAISPRQRPRCKAIIERWSLDSMLAALQILAECRARMRGSSHGRLLTELAVVRVARLENLTAVSGLVERLVSLESGAPVRAPAAAVSRRSPAPAGATSAPSDAYASSADLSQGPPSPVPVGPSSAAGAAAPRRKPTSGAGARPGPPAPPSAPAALAEVPAAAAPEPTALAEPAASPIDSSSEPVPTTPAARDAPAPTAHSARLEPAPLDVAMARKVWPDLIKKVGPSLVWRLNYVEPIAVAAPDILVIAAKPGYNLMADHCGTDDALLEIGQGLQRLLHRSVTVKYERSTESEEVAAESRRPRARGSDSLATDPMVQKVVELFEARPLQLDYGDEEA